MIATYFQQKRVPFRLIALVVALGAVEAVARFDFNRTLVGSVFDLPLGTGSLLLETFSPVLVAAALLSIDRLCRLRGLNLLQRILVAAALSATALAGYLSTDPLAVWAFVALAAMGVAALAKFSLELEEISGLGAGLAALGLCVLVPQAVWVVGAWAVVLGAVVARSRGLSAGVSFALVLCFPVVAAALGMVGVVAHDRGTGEANVLLGQMVDAVTRLRLGTPGPAEIAAVALALAAAWLPGRSFGYFRSSFVGTAIVVGAALAGFELGAVGLLASTVAGTVVAFALSSRKSAWPMIVLLYLQVSILAILQLHVFV